MIFSGICVLGFIGLSGAQQVEPTLFKAEEVPVPTTDEEKHSNIGTSKIVIGENSYDTSFIELLRTGDEVNGVKFGQLFDQNMEPILKYPMDDSYNELPLFNEGGDELISNIPDFTSLIDARIAGEGVAPYAMFVHFESPRPSITYRVNVDFTEDCQLVVDNIEAMDWSGWGGLWNPCSGKVTPWNTHLGSEEHEPDARLMTLSYDEFVSAYESGYKSAHSILQFVRYFGIYSDVPEKDMNQLATVFNPYKYGHATEMGVDSNGDTFMTKWYTLGRLSYEVAELMPDERTVYIGDDATNGVFVAFVADNARDFSSGKLFISAWNQTSDSNGGEFDLKWIELGSASQDELLEMVEGLTFDQIFEVADPEGSSCPDGFVSINAGHDFPKHECLAVKDGMETAAAFFETRRYGAMMGGTSELKVMEGIASVPSFEKLYVAVSFVTDGMAASGVTARAGEVDPDFGGPDHIRLPINPCGCVYEFDVDTGADWMMVTKGRGAVCGSVDGSDPDNSCSVDSIAQPDNLFYMGSFGSGIESLLIAEDTSNHQNDYMWAYDIESGELTRILTSVYGSQVTGPAFFSDGQGCQLLMAVVPHPYKKSNQCMVDEDLSIGLEGIVGYIGPIGNRVVE